MLASTNIFDERPTTCSTGTDFSSILNEEMHDLYLLSFLLTGDLDKAGQCFFSGIGECEEEIGVFLTRAQARARRRILKRAIWMIMPAPERTDGISSSILKHSAASGKNNVFEAILGLNAFERFVYVMSVLERLSDEDCSTLLGCSLQDVMIARTLVLERLENTCNPCGQLVAAVADNLANQCA